MSSDSPPPISDRRTTPHALRWPATLLLIAMSIYFLGCFYWALDDRQPAWTALGTWSMFALKGTRHWEVDAFAEVEGVWVPVDLPFLFPTRWDSGYRWQRGPFRRNKQRMGTLAASLCRRHRDEPTRVRFNEVSWKKVLGQHEQPRTNEKTKLLIEWNCGDRFELPRGRSL